MRETIGYHIVKSTYGQWLPGDERGSWSTAWDAELGYIKPHTLHPGDPVRQRMAQERMLHAPVLLTSEMQEMVRSTLLQCEAESAWSIVALAVQPTHLHLLITTGHFDAGKTVKWLGQEITKAIHRQTAYVGPVWCKGSWCSRVWDAEHWERTVAYIERQM